MTLERQLPNKRLWPVNQGILAGESWRAHDKMSLCDELKWQQVTCCGTRVLNNIWGDFSAMAVATVMNILIKTSGASLAFKSKPIHTIVVKSQHEIENWSIKKYKISTYQIFKTSVVCRNIHLFWHWRSVWGDCNLPETNTLIIVLFVLCLFFCFLFFLPVSTIPPEWTCFLLELTSHALAYQLLFDWPDYTHINLVCVSLTAILIVVIFSQILMVVIAPQTHH